MQGSQSLRFGDDAVGLRVRQTAVETVSRLPPRTNTTLSVRVSVSESVCVCVCVCVRVCVCVCERERERAAAHEHHLLQCLGIKVQVLGFGVWGLGFRV